MKAIRVHGFGPPEIMQREEVPDPKISTGQILVCVQSAGVNPSDTYIRSGTYTIESTAYGKIVLIPDRDFSPVWPFHFQRLPMKQLR